ncbi:MAG: hypothetical protein ABI318_13690 [Chthoniobacteraceae bacterium]
MTHLDTQLAVALQRVSALPDRTGFPDDLTASWQQQWEHAERSLRRIRNLLTHMDEHAGRGDNERLSHAMEAWKAIQSEDVELGKALDAIRSQAGRLHADARDDWNALDTEIATHLETIHSCALALRVKLELMKHYTGGEVNHVLAGMLSRLPNRTHVDTVEAEVYVQEYRQTMQDLDEERHKFGGFLDFIKGLVMWVETPEERMSKKTTHPPR